MAAQTLPRSGALITRTFPGGAWLTSDFLLGSRILSQDLWKDSCVRVYVGVYMHASILFISNGEVEIKKVRNIGTILKSARSSFDN